MEKNSLFTRCGNFPLFLVQKYCSIAHIQKTAQKSSSGMGERLSRHLIWMQLLLMDEMRQLFNVARDSFDTDHSSIASDYDEKVAKIATRIPVVFGGNCDNISPESFKRSNSFNVKFVNDGHAIWQIFVLNFENIVREANDASDWAVIFAFAKRFKQHTQFIQLCSYLALNFLIALRI